MKSFSEMVREWVEGEIDLTAQLQGLTKAAEAAGRSAAKNQLAALEEMRKIALPERVLNSATPSLAETILVQQHHRIAEWKERAYPLSEKQVAVVIKEVEQYRNKPSI